MTLPDTHDQARNDVLSAAAETDYPAGRGGRLVEIARACPTVRPLTVRDIVSQLVADGLLHLTAATGPARYGLTATGAFHTRHI